jgi:hypothetical protein
LEAAVTDDIKKQEVLKILAEIETSAMVLLKNDVVEYTAAQLVAELALIRYEIESYELISKKIQGTTKITEILDFKPKDKS